MSDPIDLDALDALAEAASPLPWDTWGAPAEQDTRAVVCPSNTDEEGDVVCDWASEVDADYIAAVVNAYPAMSAELRQARAVLAAVEGLPEKRSPERWTDLQMRDFESGYNAALAQVRAAIAGATERSDRDV